MFLRLATLGYGWGVALRNAAFQRGILKTRSLPAPVISVGNITAGGTGKTPVVAWLVNLLAGQGCRPAIVSRGYGSLGPEGNDEKKMLARLCPGVPHPQHPRRYQIALPLLQKNLADCIVLDDGFQHQQLARDLNILLIDTTNPWGFGDLLPRGRLREPLRNISRADIVLLTRCELATSETIIEITERIKELAAVPVLRTQFVSDTFSNAAGQTVPAELMRERQPLAFCGIGNPGGFRCTLANLGIDVPDRRFMAFPDHHHYSSADQSQIAERAQAAGCETLLCTHKDLVKLPESRCGTLPVWALDQRLEFIDPLDPLWNALRTLFPSRFKSITSFQ